MENNLNIFLIILNIVCNKFSTFDYNHIDLLMKKKNIYKINNVVVVVVDLNDLQTKFNFLLILF